MEVLQEVAAELRNAERARERGKEGQARVCARRAAGLAARRYLVQRGNPPRTSNAYDLLRLLADDPRLSPELKERAAHLTLRVDEEFKLPSGIDLIAEARQLCGSLLGQDPGSE